MPSAAAPGWYGKLPTVGDFAGRRLPPEFVEPWDAWLAAGLGLWRQDDAQWLDTYLAMPSLRFTLGGALPQRSSPIWVGVLMPSVDSVGRYFPLTLACALPTLPDASALVPWLNQLDELALNTLHDDWAIETLESALLALGAPPDAPSDSTLPGGLAGALTRCNRGQALWWSRPGGQGPARELSITLGLPTGAAFVQLLRGY